MRRIGSFAVGVVVGIGVGLSLVAGAGGADTTADSVAHRVSASVLEPAEPATSTPATSTPATLCAQTPAAQTTAAQTTATAVATLLATALTAQDTGPVVVPGNGPCTGTCSFFYDLGENRWHLGVSDCSVGCHCVFPIENRTSSGNLIVDCTTGLPTSFEMKLELVDSDGGIRETKLLFPTLPAGTRRWAARNYRVAIERGNFWDIRIEYDATLAGGVPSVTPLPVTPGDTIAKSTIVFGTPTGATDQRSVDHPSGANQAADYEFNGFKVTVSRTSR